MFWQLGSHSVCLNSPSPPLQSLRSIGPALTCSGSFPLRTWDREQAWPFLLPLCELCWQHQALVFGVPFLGVDPLTGAPCVKAQQLKVSQYAHLAVVEDSLRSSGASQSEEQQVCSIWRPNTDRVDVWP